MTLTNQEDESIAQAAFLLATPNPQERWFRHMDGDATALPAKSEINQQGVQRNLAIMHSWKFDVTPLMRPPGCMDIRHPAEFCAECLRAGALGIGPTEADAALLGRLWCSKCKRGE